MSGPRDLTTAEAIRWLLDPRLDSGKDDSVYVMAANYDSNGEPGDWDGMTPDDIATWTHDGVVDHEQFGLWGPFRLMWEGDKDPGEPRDWTPDEALDRVASFIEVFTIDRYGASPTLTIALEALGRFIKQVREHGSVDLEWGEPGNCWDRLVNDEDLIAEMKERAGHIVALDQAIEVAKQFGLGRHYGDPHCIWCLQAS